MQAEDTDKPLCAESSKTENTMCRRVPAQTPRYADWYSGVVGDTIMLWVVCAICAGVGRTDYGLVSVGRFLVLKGVQDICLR